MQKARFAKILLLFGIVGGSVWLQYMIDDGLGLSWPQNVVRNWEQLGFFNLHGHLVTNPGGYEALSKPDVYKGMSPFSLYPPFLCAQAFAWTGLGTLSFHVVLALAVFWAVWELLGRDSFAFAVAAASVLCPGYARWQKLLDPNSTSVLFGLPYMALVAAMLKRPRTSLLSFIALFGLTLAYTVLNWTTAWVLGLGALLLMGLPQVSRRGVFLFLVLAGLSSGVVVVGSVISKTGATAQASGASAVPGRLLADYGWGQTGYGEGMTTGKAIVRLAAVNGAGLLPILLVWLWTATKHVKRRQSSSWLAISPLVLAAIEVALMRNYFAHHPWMAAPVLLAGLTFSIALMRTDLDRASGESPFASPRLAALLAPVPMLCFLYGFIVLMFFRANEANELSLVSLVRHHTQRSDYIVVMKSVDPETARLVSRLEEVLDRHVAEADDLQNLPAPKQQVVILSSLEMHGGVEPVAQTPATKAASPSLLHRTMDWFNRTISRRRPGDRLELADVYYLYKPK